MTDCFLNPSLQETFGKATAEALCCETPVIVYNTTACHELIGRGCGEIMPLGDKINFMNKIRYVIDNPDLYKNCRSWAVNMFDKDKNIRQYMDIFEELILSRKK